MPSSTCERVPEPVQFCNAPGPKETCLTSGFQSPVHALAAGTAPPEGKVIIEVLSFWNLCKIAIHSSFERLSANAQRRQAAGANARQPLPEANQATRRMSSEKPLEQRSAGTYR